MCAECHATNVRKNYDAAEDRFHTTFSEASVGCEACHGPGAEHVRWARNGRPSSVAKGFFLCAVEKGRAELGAGSDDRQPRERFSPRRGER